MEIPTLDDFTTKTNHLITLFNLIKENKEKAFLEYLSKLNQNDVNINMRDENGNYLIFFAVTMNNGRILKKLIDFGSRLDIIDTSGHSILYYPIKLNYAEIVDILLDHDQKTIGLSLLNIIDKQNNVPIFYAIKYKNYGALQKLLNHNADPNYQKKTSALHMAVLKENIPMVELIIKYIKNINSRTSNGSTALHLAANFQLDEIVKILLENGANQDIGEYEYNFYPIFYSVAQNNLPITKLFVEYHANPNHQDYIGNTIMHYCVMNQYDDIFFYLLDQYPINTFKNTLHSEKINQSNSLPGNYIDPNIVNIDGLSVVHLVLYHYHEKYLDALKKMLPYSKINYQDNNGNTPLHLITENNLWSDLKDLLGNKKLNLFIKNNQGKTIFDIIRLQNKNDIIDTVIRSYYHYLKKHSNSWLQQWQNQCSKIKLEEIDEDKCLELIKDQVINEKKSVPIKKDKKNIVIANDEVVHFSTFTGSLLDMLSGYKYLTKKYPNATSIFHTRQRTDPEMLHYYQSLGIQDNPHQHLIHFEIRWIYQKLFFPPKFNSLVNNIIQSNKYRFIIIPIGIVLSNGNHSNCLFIDLKKNTVERFEPHGSAYPNRFNYNPDRLDSLLENKFNEILTKIKYLKPVDYLPKIGFQSFESVEANINKNIGDPNGFCTLWTIWYLDYRIKYFDQKPKKIVKKLINQIRINNYSFRTIIRNYSKRITDLRDSYLKTINRNVNDYLNNRLTQSELENLVINIINS